MITSIVIAHLKIIMLGAARLLQTSLLKDRKTVFHRPQRRRQSARAATRVSFKCAEAARVIQIPHRAPDANAFAESFIGTIKRECLDFFICFSRSQLDYILRTWVRH